MIFKNIQTIYPGQAAINKYLPQKDEKQLGVTQNTDR